MATRTISTKVAVKGESEFRAAISSVNAELRNMQSALKMTETQYKNNANSTEALTAKGKALNDLFASQKSKVSALETGLKNAQQADERYAQKKADLTRKIEENAAALKRLQTQSGDTTAEQKKLTEENERLDAELKKNEANLIGAQKAVNNWQTDLNKAKTSVIETQAAIDENSAALSQNSEKAKANGTAIDTLAAALVSSGIKKSLREITEALTACVNASVDFESAMAGVAKTTDLTDEELQGMGDAIKQLSTEIPIAGTELAGVVEVAGQLGIAKEDLVDFSTVMANLGASTNLTAEEAALMLAQFANVTKMDPSMYENLGSTIVALGNNFETDEQKITSMAQRMAASGAIAGLTQQEILALATAVSSVGIEAEAGGTAMNKTFTAIETAVATGSKKLDTYAEVAGMSAAEFSEAWETKPVTAIEAFLKGLGSLEDAGGNVTLILDELGLTGDRQSNMLKSLGQASEKVSTALQISNTAWAENTALMKEAGTRYETTESKLTMFKNSVTNLETAVGDQLTPALGKLADEGKDVVKWATEFVEANTWLAPSITAAATALGVMGTALSGVLIYANVILPAFKALKEAMTATSLITGAWTTLILAAVAALAVFVATLPPASSEANDLRDSMENLADGMKEADDAFSKTVKSTEAASVVAESYVKRLKELEEQGLNTKESQAEYRATVDALNAVIPGLNLVIDEQTGLINQSTDALLNNISAWKEQAMQAAYSAKAQEQVNLLVDAQVSLDEANTALVESEAATSDAVHKTADAMVEYNAAAGNLAEARRGLFTGDVSTSEFEEALAAEEAASARLQDAMLQLSEDEITAAQSQAALKEEISTAQEAIEGYEEKIQTLYESMGNVGDSANAAAEGIADASAALEDAGEVSGEGIKEGFDSSIAGMSDSVAAEMADTQAVVEGASDSVVATATDMGSQAASGFASEIDGMVDAAKQAVSDATLAVSQGAQDAYNAGYSVGSNISLGAKAGIMAYAYLVAQEAAQMVTDAINAAKLAADSHSPSKKTMQLGRDLDKGLILGIQEQEDKILDAIKSTMAKVSSVKVAMPEIYDSTDTVLKALSGSSADSRLDRLASSVADKLVKAQKPVTPVNVTQNIYAEDTSYAGQQREAARQMKQLARELNR